MRKIAELIEVLEDNYEVLRVTEPGNGTIEVEFLSPAEGRKAHLCDVRVEAVLLGSVLILSLEG